VISRIACSNKTDSPWGAHKNKLKSISEVISGITHSKKYDQLI
jgi:hypothetical protein